MRYTKKIEINEIDGWQLKSLSTLKNVNATNEFSMLEVALWIFEKR